MADNMGDRPRQNSVQFSNLKPFLRLPAMPELQRES